MHLDPTQMKWLPVVLLVASNVFMAFTLLPGRRDKERPLDPPAAQR